jgi:hypothetical protein
MRPASLPLRGFALPFFVFVLTCSLIGAIGAAPLAPTSAPSSNPAGASAAATSQHIRAWFAQLADRDADVRDKAQTNLMGLSSAQLPELRAVVAESVPLRPSQAVVLRDIVSHVFIAGLEYEADADRKPFLGLRWPMTLIGPLDDPADGPGDGAGVPVVERIRGFGAYHMLRSGDLIRRIEDKPEIRLENQGVFTRAIQGFHAGDPITLTVERGGKLIQLPVRLRPLPVDAVRIDALIDEQEQRADKYWDEQFRPLLGENVS